MVGNIGHFVSVADYFYVVWLSVIVSSVPCIFACICFPILFLSCPSPCLSSHPPPSFLYFPFNFNVILLCWPYWIVQHSAYDCNVVYFSISLILHNFTMIRRKHKCDVCRFPRIFHKLICT